MHLATPLALFLSTQGLEADPARASARTPVPPPVTEAIASVPAAAAVGGTSLPVEYLWQDFDRDGRVDVYVRGSDRADRLLQNTGAEFRDVTDTYHLAGRDSSLAVTWTDFDADGLPDLHRVTEEGRSRLLHNAGTLFIDVTDAAGAAHSGRVLFHEWIGHDDDPLPDLHLVTEESDVLFKNLGAGRFTALPLPADPAGIESLRGRIVAGLARVVSPGPPADRDPHADTAAPRRPVSAREGFEQRAGRSGGTQELGVCSSLDIENQGAGGCLEASSVPTLGMLYPLSADLNVDGTGRVGIGTTSPTRKLDVDGAIRSRSGGIEFPDGSTQTKAAAGIATSAFAAGPASDPTATLQFLAPPARVRVAAGQKIFVSSHRGMGTRNQGGACCLSLWIGHRLVPSGSIVVVGPGMLGNEAARNTRSLYSSSAVISGLPAGTYEVGMVGGTADAPHWDSNGAGYTSAVVFE